MVWLPQKTPEMQKSPKTRNSRKIKNHCEKLYICLVFLFFFVWYIFNKPYGTKVRVSDIEQRNVSGAEIYGVGFTVKAKSSRWGIAKVDRE